MQRALLLAAACLLFGGVAPVLGAPKTTSGLSFSCDVNTTKCRCEGTLEGADCQAMLKNCKGGTYDICMESPEMYCVCTMARATLRSPRFSPTSPTTLLAPN